MCVDVCTCYSMLLLKGADFKLKICKMWCFYQSTSLCVKDMYCMSLTKKLCVIIQYYIFLKHASLNLFKKQELNKIFIHFELKGFFFEKFQQYFKCFFNNLQIQGSTNHCMWIRRYGKNWWLYKNVLQLIYYCMHFIR